MSKYQSLWEYLKNNKRAFYQLTYENIENILGFPIDHSFLTYKKEAIKYGYQVDKISLKDKNITFKKL